MSVFQSHQQRRATSLGNPVRENLCVLGDKPAPFLHPGHDGTGRTLADLAPVHVDARHTGLRGERDPFGIAQLALVPFPQPVLLLGQDDDRAAFGGLVGERGQLRGVREFVLRHAVDRQELGRLPVAQGDGAGLVEEQGGHVSRRLDRTPGHGQDVALDEAVHTGDADRGEQRTDGGRDQADQERGEHDHRGLLVGARVDGERLQGDHGQQEDDGEGRQKDVQGDLVGGLLPGRTLHQADHPVDERLARLRRDLDDDPVGEHLCAAGHRTAVAA